MATFNSGADRVATNYNFVSFFNVHKPDVDGSLTERFGSELLTGLLDMVGQKKVTTNLQYSHHETQRKMPKIKATNGGAGGAGAVVQFTLDAAASSSYGLNNSPYDTGSALTQNGVPVRLYDTILVKPSSGTVSWGSYIHAQVIAVDAVAGTFDAQPFDSTQSIPSVPSADEIIIYGNAHGEGSKQPESMDTKTVEYTNNVQIIKETYKITGSENSVKLWFEIDGKPYWTFKGEKDAYHRFLNNRELTLLVSEKISNTGLYDTVTAADGALKTTEGLIPFITSQGNNFSYAGVQGLTLADMEDIVVTLDKQKGAKENMMCNGINLDLQLDRELGDRFVNGGISYGNFNFSEEKKVNLQFKSFRVGSYTFHKKTYDAFNDLQTLGANGYGFPYEGMVIPMDSQVDPKSGEKIPSLRMRYLEEKGQTSREIKSTYIDEFKTTADGKDVEAVRYLSECGFEGFAGNRFFYINRL